MNKLLRKQELILDDDTFNFLVELRLLNLGTYDTLVKFSIKSPRECRHWVQQAQRYWKLWLGDFNVNIFQISTAARQGLL